MSADVVSFDVGQAVRDMGCVFKTRWDGPNAIAAYIRALGTLPSDEVVAACQHLVETHDGHMPKPAQVRRTVFELRARGGRRSSGPTDRPLPETQHNPETGQYEIVYSCRVCQDAGWAPVTSTGVLLSWSDVRAGLERHHAVRRCACKGGPA